jgi:hypothetical protein
MHYAAVAAHFLTCMQVLYARDMTFLCVLDWHSSKNVQKTKYALYFLCKCDCLCIPGSSPDASSADSIVRLFLRLDVLELICAKQTSKILK